MNNPMNNTMKLFFTTSRNQRPNPLYFWEQPLPPTTWVSLLIPSYNTNAVFLQECIESIKHQTGAFGLEIVWIDDCSTLANSATLRRLLHRIIHPLPYCQLVYEKMNTNKGISYCLHHGVTKCSHELIFRFDSDDVMKPSRIEKQLQFMIRNPASVLCGTNITSFHRDLYDGQNSTHPAVLTWAEYKRNPQSWILNHPTLCFRKSAIVSVGNYRENFEYPFEDLELELRVLKKYGVVYNLRESLVFYRIHDKQASYKNNRMNKALIAHLIQQMIHE